jgi:hypothetical protein
LCPFVTVFLIAALCRLCSCLFALPYPQRLYPLDLFIFVLLQRFVGLWSSVAGKIVEWAEACQCRRKCLEPLASFWCSSALLSPSNRILLLLAFSSKHLGEHLPVPAVALFVASKRGMDRALMVKSVCATTWGRRALPPVPWHAHAHQTDSAQQVRAFLSIVLFATRSQTLLATWHCTVFCIRAQYRPRSSALSARATPLACPAPPLPRWATPSNTLPPPPELLLVMRICLRMLSTSG